MITEKRLKRLSDPDYRDEYARSTVTAWVVHQLRALREERGWTQADLGEKAGKAQSAIGRFESESYGNWNANTLHELARAFDVALQIRFISWPEFMTWTSDTSPRRMYVPGFDPAVFSTTAPLQYIGPEQGVHAYGDWYRDAQKDYGRPGLIGQERSPLKPLRRIEQPQSGQLRSH